MLHTLSLDGMSAQLSLRPAVRSLWLTRAGAVSNRGHHVRARRRCAPCPRQPTGGVDQIAHAFPAGNRRERHHLDALLWPDLSENEQTRRAQLPATLDEYRDELRRYIRRYDDLRARRLDALSNYDIGIAYRGGAGTRSWRTPFGLWPTISAGQGPRSTGSWLSGTGWHCRKWPSSEGRFASV